MNVNEINSVASVYDTHETIKANKAEEAKAEIKNEDADKGVVYEHSEAKANKTKSYKPDKAMIAKLKADAEARTSQLKSLVEKMLMKQGQKIAEADDMWKFLAEGKFEVDEATKAQAQEDISEDGYWGVKQTSERILSFAKALTGGDPSKVEEMRSAFKKGFEAATKTWGKDLPEISQKTYDAVMEAFDKWAAGEEEAAE